MNLLRSLLGWREISVEDGKSLEKKLQQSPQFRVLATPDSAGSIVKSYYRICNSTSPRVEIELEHVLEPWDEPLSGPSYLKQRMKGMLLRADLPPAYAPL